MTYNLRCASEVSPNSWSERKDAMVQLLQKESPDIIGTQEGLYHQLQDLTSELSEYDWIGLGREGGSQGEFMAIFYKKDRFQPLAFNHFWLSNDPLSIGSISWGSDCVRMATWVRFLDRQTGRTFYHLNTHLDHISDEARLEGTKVILQMIEQFQHDDPYFITGDFNTDSDSDTYALYTDQGQFRDVWHIAHEKINEDIGSFNNFKDPSGGKSRIDWMFCRGDVEVHIVKTIDDQFDGQFPSDHFPIMAYVKI